MEEESVYFKNKSIIKWVLQNSTVLILYTVAKDSRRPERGCQTDSSRVCRVEKYSGQKEKGFRAGHTSGEISRVCIRQRRKWWGLKFIHYQNIKLMPSLLDNVNVRHHSISKHKGTFFLMRNQIINKSFRGNKIWPQNKKNWVCCFTLTNICMYTCYTLTV